MSASPAALPPGHAEAARYALLRRLAPSMRHHLVTNLQPIGMICEVMDRRLRAPEPNLAQVHEGANKLNTFARAALNSCLDVVTWLAPEDGASSTVAEGATECLALLATSLSFRGYALRNEVGDLPGGLQRAALRTLVTATLIHATDELPAPAELILSAQPAAIGVEITLVLRPGQGGQGLAQEPAYRQLDWSDMQALAEAEGVALDRVPGERISLVIPWAAAA